MLVFLSLLSLASAATLQENRVQLVPSSIHSVSRPISLVQLLRSPISSQRDTVQYVGQTHYGFQPNRQQYSIVSVEPDIYNQYSIESVRPYQQQQQQQQQLVYAVQPQIEQLSIGTVQQEQEQEQLQQQQQQQQLQQQLQQRQQQQQQQQRQQRKQQQQQLIYTVQPQAEQLSLGAVQPYNVESRYILQPVTDQGSQVVSLAEPDLYKSPIDNLRITTEVHPLQYSNVVQSVQQSPVSVSVHSRPSVSVEDSDKGALSYSYFLKGSDGENKEVVNQAVRPQISVLRQLEPPQYSSVSVLQPRISSIVLQPSRQVSVHGVVQPQQQVGVVGYSRVSSNSGILSQPN